MSSLYRPISLVVSAVLLLTVIGCGGNSQSAKPDAQPTLSGGGGVWGIQYRAGGYAIFTSSADGTKLRMWELDVNSKPTYKWAIDVDGKFSAAKE